MGKIGGSGCDGKDSGQESYQDGVCVIAGTVGSAGGSVFNKVRVVMHYTPISCSGPHPAWIPHKLPLIQ